MIGNTPGSDEVPADGCTGTTCDAADHRCNDDDAADVIVDASGNVVDVICYGRDVVVTGSPADVTPDHPSLGNNSLLVIDGVNDGVDVIGGVTITGNNAGIYGQGPDVSVVDGTVDVQKNNAQIRGVRIQGDVIIDKNNAKLVLCVIEGNLTIRGNNATLAACDVFGETTVLGQNTALVGDRFGGPLTLSGGNTTCSTDLMFDDTNADGVVDASELGAMAVCPGK